MKRKSIILLLAVITILGISSLIWREVSSFRPWQADPETRTRSAFIELLVRAGISMKAGAIPDSMDDLPLRAGYTNATTDGWGTPIRFTMAQDPPNGIVKVVVVSAGEDRTFGTADDLSDSKDFDVARAHP